MTETTAYPIPALERFTTPVSERELFRAYSGRRHTDNVYEQVLLFRIRELWAHHRWFQSHLGWLHESEQENRAELRHLLRVARLARRVERADREPPAYQFDLRGDGWTEAELREGWER